MNLWNADKRDWQSNVSISKMKLQMNLWEVDKRDWQRNVSIRRTKLQMNLSDVAEKRDCQSKGSIRKKKLPMNLVNGGEKRLLTQREYHKSSSTNSTIPDEIQKFHAVVSRGPLYICSCCDQLWYIHSVFSAEKLRLSNPNAGKYSPSKTSVDDIKWIWQSCDKNLKKNKIPPYAAKNGMSFAVKPDFFLVK